MSKSELMDLTVICQGFPAEPEPSISREPFIETINSYFEHKTLLVCVKGEVGIGKTALLAQFVRSHANEAISLFIKPMSYWTHDVSSLLFNLCNQLQWITEGEELSDPEERGDTALQTLLRTQLTRLQRLARRKMFYFVVDGLDTVAAENAQLREQMLSLLSLLPFGYSSNFRFLFSGDLVLRLSNVKSLTHEYITLTPFSLDETARYLQDFKLEEQALHELHRTIRGNPSHLAAIRRIWQPGTDVGIILDQLSGKLPDLFKIEWSKVDQSNRLQMVLLAILAYEQSRYTSSELAHILQVDVPQILEITINLNFIAIDPQTQGISFVSEPFRSFARTQLSALRKEVTDLLIASWFAEPDSEQAYSNLPEKLATMQKYTELLSYLSPERFTNMIEHKQSLVPVQRATEFGIQAARTLERDEDLMRFSMQQSIMTDSTGIEARRSEIEARIALNDYDAALALAQGAVLKEERFHMLAIIVKIKRQQGLQPELELLEQIRQLYEQLEPESLGKRAVEIAADLLYSDPKLAITLVEKATRTNPDENALDWAFAKLSLAALGMGDGRVQMSDAFDDIQSRIQDPRALRISEEAALVVEQYSASTVIAKCQALDNASDRMYLLGKWTVANRERDDVVEVIDYAFEIFKTTGYAPNIKTLREITTPLPFINETSKVIELIRYIDSQIETVVERGPTEEYVRLQLILARAEQKHNRRQVAYERVIDIYLHLTYDSIDPVTQLECLARLTAALSDIDPLKELETKDALHSSALNDLNSKVVDLLGSTAEHYYIVRGTVRALAKSKWDVALKIIPQVNTEERRDLVLLDFIESRMRMSADQLDFAPVKQALLQFGSAELRDVAVVAIAAQLAKISTNSDVLTKETISFINDYVAGNSKVSNLQIQDAGERCRACYLAYSFLIKQDRTRYSGLISRLLAQLDESWQNIDVGWKKIDIGFEITQAFAKQNIEKARQYFELTEAYQEEITLNSPTSALTNVFCIRLAIRAYSGLLPKHYDTPEDLVYLANLIESLPSNGEQVCLWCEVALRYISSRRSDDCKQIIDKYVRPLLQKISEKDTEYRSNVIIHAAPALYYANKTITLEQLTSMPQPYRDNAYFNIAGFILRKRSLSDAYEEIAEHGYDLTPDEVLEICGLLQEMQHDSMIYFLIETIAASMVGTRQRRERFSHQQKQDILFRLKEIVKTKFPDPRNIKHKGYLIAARTQLARIEQADSVVWLGLIESARQDIPNIADRAFVLSIIGAALPSKEIEKRKQVLEEALQCVESIPVELDRIERYMALASKILLVDGTSPKKYLELAMQTATQSHTPEIIGVQKGIIDFAYKLDPELAASLASLGDNDPARRSVKDHLQMLDVKKKLTEQLLAGKSLESAIIKHPQAAWKLLGSLNANRAEPVPFEHTRELMQLAAALPMVKGYPLLALVIENAVCRYSKTQQAQRYIRPLFLATLLGSELAEQMATRSIDQMKRTQRYIATDSRADSDVKIIKPGGREEAIQYLKQWFEQQVQEYLKICDPFFGPEELEILRVLRSVNPNCRVEILTSKKHQVQEKVELPLADTYRRYWRIHISDQDPPETDIVVIGIRSSGESPIHDRWWLTKNSGLRIGTSLNSLGRDKASEMSQLSKEAATSHEQELDQYLKRLKRDHDGEKLLYEIFTLES